MSTHDVCLKCPAALACIVGYVQARPRTCHSCQKLVMPLRPDKVSILTYGAMTPCFEITEDCPITDDWTTRFETFQCKECHDKQLLEEIRAARKAGETVVS